MVLYTLVWSSCCLPPGLCRSFAAIFRNSSGQIAANQAKPKAWMWDVVFAVVFSPHANTNLTLTLLLRGCPFPIHQSTCFLLQKICIADTSFPHFSTPGFDAKRRHLVGWRPSPWAWASCFQLLGLRENQILRRLTEENQTLTGVS